jgi:hypothetical protein
MMERLSAISLMAAAIMAVPLVAEARIEISPPTEPQPLRLSGAQLRGVPNVIVFEETWPLAAPQSFPGGCVNCGTLRLSHRTNAFLMGRSDRFSREFYGSGGRRIVLLPP